MLRYLALLWNPSNPDQLETARRLETDLAGASLQWRRAMQLDGFSLFCAGEEDSGASCTILQGYGGVVLGTAFAARAPDLRDPGLGHSPYDRLRLDNAASRRVFETRGRHLIAACWGSYVAILHEPYEATWVLRSPTGTLPCFHTRSRNIDLVFSSTWDLPSSVLSEYSVNWSFIARTMLKLSAGDATGFNEVTEIQGGECLQVRRGQSTRSRYWDSLDVGRVEPIDDRSRAVRMLRATVRACVHAWAANHRVIMHRLSGGLDSSIVLSCLADAPTRPRLICVNRHSEGSDGDERAFARAAANCASCELIEMPRDSASFRFEDLLRAQVSEQPQDYIGELGQYAPERELARNAGASGLFCGDFGDQLFYGLAPALAVSDYVHLHGIGRELLAVALNAAKLEGFSIWRILRDNVPRGLWRSCWDPIPSARKHNVFLVEQAASALVQRAADTRPWFDRRRYVPPGKQLHLCAIPSNAGGYYAFEKLGDPHYVPCLLSQPIAELCLRIPTYALTYGGWDRAAARDAFAAALPAQIIRRRVKGGNGEYSFELIRRNADFIRELLLNGELVQQGLLERRKIEEAVTRRPSKLLRGTVWLRRYIAVEVWLAVWKQRLAESDSARRRRSAA